MITTKDSKTYISIKYNPPDTEKSTAMKELRSILRSQLVFAIATPKYNKDNHIWLKMENDDEANRLLKLENFSMVNNMYYSTILHGISPKTTADDIRCILENNLKQPADNLDIIFVKKNDAGKNAILKSNS